MERREATRDGWLRILQEALSVTHGYTHEYDIKGNGQIVLIRR